ncbi:FlgO family outer membrane protein [Thauera mechernichensis]|uniref:FlgO family outer membrane protein n=1 Tax=Thauera mechernichensis TaxID=82788 RepID=A0ABW3WH44_9RHOO|nr:FlgO family outer membrane protein [Thauera mechernichensis]MDG3063789.1 FlgO family outer membrane protein [Thauera mechernichensis]
MRRTLLAGLAGALALGLGGCATNNINESKAPTYEQAAANPLIPANYAAATTLLSRLQGQLVAGHPLIAATVVNIDALDRSSTLGRVVSEQVAARFTLAGYRMIEMKLRNNVYMARDQGELMLTREIRDIATAHEAQAVVVGTYAQSSEMVFINLKVIEPDTNVVLAVHDYALPLDSVTRSMLRANR